MYLLDEATLKRNESLVKELKDMLIESGLFSNVGIYFNNKYISEDKKKEDVDVKKYLEYCNPKTVSMTFEGSLYEIINYSGGKIVRDLESLFKKYNLYYELGYAWSLSLYDI